MGQLKSEGHRKTVAVGAMFSPSYVANFISMVTTNELPNMASIRRGPSRHVTLDHEKHESQRRSRKWKC
jgi:hypothetical protein